MITKRLIQFLFTLCLLVVLTAVGLILFVDPNRYKDFIVSKASEQLQRPIAINGDIEWRFWPRLGLGLEGVQIGQQNSKDPLADIGKMSLYAQLRPLLHKQLEVDKLIMQNAVFYLPNQIHLNIDELDTALHLEPKNHYYEATEGSVKMSVKGLDGLAEAQTINLTFDKILADKNNEQISANNLKAKIFDGELFINGTATHLDKTPSLEGKITAHNLNPRLIAQTFGYPVLPSNDAVLKKLDLDATFKNAADGFAMQPFNAQLDESKITGDIHIHSLNTPDVTFNFNIDKINLDHYFAKKEASSISAAGNTPAEKKFEKKYPIKAEGTLTIDELIVSGLTLTQTQANLAANNNIIRVDPLKTNLYLGTLETITVVNLQQATPHWDINATLNKVDIGPFLKALIKHDQITGQFNMNTKISANGSSAHDFINSLNGNAAMTLENGIIRGVDFGYWLTVGESMLQAHKIIEVATAPLEAIIAHDNQKQTPFQKIWGTFQINQGILNNQDLVMTSDQLYTTGQGIVDLPKHQIDYALRISRAQNQGAQVPLKIRGDLSKPKIGIDPSGIQGLLVTGTKTGIQDTINQAAPLTDTLTNTLKGILGK